jgi:2-isopropylmalate synthase
MQRIDVLDTTLRDGEQSPGAAMSRDEKVAVACALEKLGVDVIEAGFPVAGRVDYEAVYQIASSVRESSVCAFSRAVKGDIDAAASALKNAKRPRIHTFIATSDLHLKAKLRISREEALTRAVEAVRYARNFTDEVQFSFEDAGRSDVAFLARMARAVVRAGAQVVNLPDTVGYQIPSEVSAMVRAVCEAVEERAIVAIHTHDDLGLAVANTLAAIEAGARQIEVSINGIGERAGNAPLEEMAMIFATRMGDRFQTGIRSQLIGTVSELVSRTTGMAIAPNKAIVGQNAFSHGSGIHQDGMLKASGTYEILSAESVGAQPGRLVLTRHSGRKALQAALAQMGAEIEQGQMDEIYAAYKEMAQKHKVVPAEAIAQLVGTKTA